ncbi:MAG: hypothetical protein VX463_20120, partial [Pseudomonadota bacterium]|nr:hypothetical protein [Pseudomonadota bacterium]
MQNFHLPPTGYGPGSQAPEEGEDLEIVERNDVDEFEGEDGGKGEGDAKGGNGGAKSTAARATGDVKP